MTKWLELKWKRWQAQDLRVGILVAAQRREEALASAGAQNAHIAAMQKRLLRLNSDIAMLTPADEIAAAAGSHNRLIASVDALRRL